MPGGLSLGGAFFTVYGDNAQLLQTMAEARTATSVATKAMADAQTAYAEAAKATSTASRASWKAIGDSYVTDTQRASASVKQLSTVLEGYGVKVGGAAAATEGMTLSLKSLGATLATLSGFGAIASGALVVRESFLAVADASQKLNQEQFTLGRQFGALAPMFAAQAKDLAALSGKSYTDAIAATNQYATVMQQYGIKASQVSQIQLIGANAAALHSTTLEEAAKRIGPALRGEAEAIEYLGFSLQSDYLRSLQDVNSENYKRWQQMGPMAKSQAILNELQKQSNAQTGAAAEYANSAAGANAKMTASFNDAAAALGQRFNPALAATANWLSNILNGVTASLNQAAEVDRAIKELGRVPGFNAAHDPEILAIIARNKALDEARGKEAEIADSREKDRLRLLEDARNQIKTIADLHKQATEKEIDGENAAYQEKKAALEVDKQARIEAADASKQAALDGIRDEKLAAEDLYQARLAHLQVLKQAELQDAEDRHTAATRTLEAEKHAAEEASKYQIRGLEATRDAALKTSDDRKQIELDEIEAVKRERDAARVGEDRALADETERVQRAAQDRHAAITRQFEADAVAIRAAAEEETRSLDASAKKAEARHRSRLAHIEAESKAAEKQHRETLARLEVEGKAAEETHRLALVQIEAEATAAKSSHDQQTRAIEDRLTAAQRLHDDQKQALADELDAARTLHDQRNRALADEVAAAQSVHDLRNRALAVEVATAQSVHDLRNRALADELDAAQHVHDLRNRGLEDQLAAATTIHTAIVDGLEVEKNVAQAIHTQTVRNLQDQLDEAERLHRAESDALDERKRAEDARHATAMANLDQELKSQTDQIDAQLRLLDDATRTDTHANRLADLQTALGVAQSSGNSATIAKAERDLAAETANFERDQLRSTLQAAKANAKDRIDVEKDLARSRHDQIDDEIDAEKRLSDTRLAATKAVVDAGKQAADDEFALISASIAARKDRADRELESIRQTVAVQKQANDDALALIKTQVDAARQANDDELARIKTTADAARQANDDELARIKTTADAARAANDDSLAETQDRIEARQRELDDALEKLRRESTDRKQALDDELARIQTQLGKRKDQADEELRLTKVVLDGRKIAADEEYTSRKESLDKQKLAADEGYLKDKERIDKRKVDVKDETTALLLELDARKKGEEDRYLAEQRNNNDTHDLAVRNLQDQRTREDLAETDRKTQVERAHKDEQEHIKATADAAILASRDALDKYQIDAGLRKQAVDAVYNNEKDQIRATYDDPETGLIPKLKKTYDDTKKWYDLRTIEVNRQYQNERDQIRDTFDDKEKGLFAKLAQIHEQTVEGLKHTEEDWQKNFQKPVLAVIDKTLETAGKAIDIWAAKHGLAPVGDEGSGGRQGGPGGDGPGPVPGGIPSPYRVTFPYDAPYNGPFPGGAMWAGGPPRHQGIDLALPGPNNGMGKPYQAFQPGSVYWQGYEPAGGNGMIIRTDDGLYNYYGHSQRFLVGTGDHVDAGEDIGILGESGTEGSPHLHYAVRTDVNSGHIDPVPYLTGGGAHDGDAGEPSPGDGIKIKDGYLTFALFGQQYKIKLPASTGLSGRVGQWIDLALKQAGLPSEWATAMAQIAAVESGERNSDGSVKIGTGNPKAYNPESVNGEHAQGLMQMLPSTFRAYLPRDKDFKDDIEDPLSSVASAGWYIKRRYHDPWGTPYFKHGSFDWRGVTGYRHGGVIPEPTLLVGQTLGPYAMAGESATEWVTPEAPRPTPAQTTHSSISMPIMIGNREVERLWIDGYNLNVQRGRQFSGLS